MTHTTTPTPVRPDPIAETPAHGRGVVVGWALAASGVAAAGVLILAVTSSGPAPEPATTPAPNSSLANIPQTPDIAERWLAHHSDVLGAGRPTTGWPVGVPRSADAAERWFALQQYGGWPVGAPQSADAAERWFAQQQTLKQSSTPTPGRYAGWPEGVPHSADGADRTIAQQR